MKRGFLPPVPIEFFGPDDLDTINLWKTFFIASDEERRNWVELGKRNIDELPFFYLALIGMVNEKEIGEFWYPENCFGKFLRKVVDILKKEGKSVIAFKYPPIRNIDFFKKVISQSLDFLGISESEMETRLQAWNSLRNVVKRLDCVQVQTRGKVIGSYSYVEALHSVLDPTQSLPKISRTAETIVAIKSTNSNREPFLKVGIVEMSPFQQSFYSTIEKFNGIVVYDELGIENFPLDNFSDLSYLYSQVTFPLGIKTRKDKIAKAIQLRGIDVLIYGTFDFTEIKSNADYLQRELKIPLFIYKIPENEQKEKIENSLLEIFLKNVLDQRNIKK